MNRFNYYNNKFFVVRLVAVIFALCMWANVGYAKDTAILKSVSFSALPNQQVMIRLQFSASVNNPKTFTMNDPARLVLDFGNVDSALKKNQGDISLGVAQEYMVVSEENRLRVVLNLSQIVKYSLSTNGSTVLVTLAGGPKIVMNPKHEQLTHSRQGIGAVHNISSVDFRGNYKQGGQLVIGISDAGVGVDVQQGDNNITLKFFDTRLPERLARRYDVADFSTPVKNVMARQEGRNAVFQIFATGNYDHFAYQVDKQFIVDFKTTTDQSQKKAKDGPPVYSGKIISLNFQNIKVRSVLQLLAEFTGTNMVVSDSVKGEITLRLNNVPWDQALDIILRTRGLAKRQVGGIMMIAPSQEMYAQEEQELKASSQVKDLAPLEDSLLQIKYAKAEDLVELLKTKGNSLLSERGSVSVDKRTNTIWIQDTGQKIQEVRDLIRQLDKPVRQVLIESRIVTIDKAYEKDIGIRFGVSKATHLSGTLDGANALSQGTTIPNVPIDQRLNVNLPAPSTDDLKAASVGLAIAKLGGGVVLDLELSALESEGGGEIIANPHLVTADQQAALIESGEEIPYEESTSSGATSVAFKKAVLSLQVTPQITPDNRIVLNLTVNQDTVSSRMVNNVPAINTKQLQTRVLVDNGQTIVLGGIYQQDKKDSVDRVPFLGTLPVVGALFRHKHVEDTQQEMLIFITPKIIQQNNATT